MTGSLAKPWERSRALLPLHQLSELPRNWRVQVCCCSIGYQGVRDCVDL